MNLMMLLMQMFKGENPQGVLIKYIRENAPNNQAAMEAVNKYEQGDYEGFRSIVSNMCKSQGRNPDQILEDTQKQFGAK